MKHVDVSPEIKSSYVELGMPICELFIMKGVNSSEKGAVFVTGNRHVLIHTLADAMLASSDLRDLFFSAIEVLEYQANGRH